ncbi:attacin-like [Ostrinia nubilalis]|uniref:attacin-like n=1 Tax=Ostrinia nubilalis TaxID=29057 RepID=UPI003082610F
MLSLVFALGCLLVGVNSQGAVSMGVNSDGSSSFGAKLPLVTGGGNQLSAIGQIAQPTGAITKGLALDTAAGHGLSVSHTNLPGFGSQLTGAGRLGLVHSGNHQLDVNAFATRNMPTKFPGAPNFNTVGGNLDYMFKNRVGATLSASHTPFLQRTDYSAMGKLNLFQSPSTRFDVNAGLQRSITPQFSQTQPFGGFSLTKFFKRR